MKSVQKKKYLVIGFFLVAMFAFLNFNFQCTPEEKSNSKNIIDKPESKIESDVFVLDSRSQDISTPIAVNLTYLVDSYYRNLGARGRDESDYSMNKKLWSVTQINYLNRIKNEFGRYKPSIYLAPDFISECLGESDMDIVSTTFPSICQGALKNLALKKATIAPYFKNDHFMGGDGEWQAMSDFIQDDFEESFAKATELYEKLFLKIYGREITTEEKVVYLDFDSNFSSSLESKEDLTFYRQLLEDNGYKIFLSSSFKKYYSFFDHYITNVFRPKMDSILTEENMQGQIVAIPTVPAFSSGRSGSGVGHNEGDLKKFFLLTYFNWKARYVKNKHDRLFPFSVSVSDRDLFTTVGEAEALKRVFEWIENNYSIYNKITTASFSSHQEMVTDFMKIENKIPNATHFNYPLETLVMTYYYNESVLRKYLTTGIFEEEIYNDGQEVIGAKFQDQTDGGNFFHVLLSFSDNVEVKESFLPGGMLSSQLFYRTSRDIEFNLSEERPRLGGDFMVIYEK